MNQKRGILTLGRTSLTGSAWLGAVLGWVLGLGLAWAPDCVEAHHEGTSAWIVLAKAPVPPPSRKERQAVLRQRAAQKEADRQARLAEKAAAKRARVAEKEAAKRARVAEKEAAKKAKAEEKAAIEAKKAARAEKQEKAARKASQALPGEAPYEEVQPEYGADHGESFGGE